MAYFYTKLAIHSSLKTAVNVCTFGMIGVLVLIWHLLTYNWPWMLYVFNAFVSLFSITLVSQGWLVAANIFTTREAKRLYGLLGVSAVIGAAFGGSFTSIMVHYIGSRNLLLASAGFVLLAYFAFLGVTGQKGVKLSRRRRARRRKRASRLRSWVVHRAISSSAGDHGDYRADVHRRCHGRVPVQCDGQAGLYQPAGTDGVSRQFLRPVAEPDHIRFAVFPYGVRDRHFRSRRRLADYACFDCARFDCHLSGAGRLVHRRSRLTEAATRYSFNRTGMELLYMPLPLELRNRTKAFTDIFMDRFSRGIGGILLIFLSGTLNLSVRQLSLAVIAYTIVWVFLSLRAKNEYVSTVRKRIASRRLDLESLRVNVSDAATVRLLEEATESTTRGKLSMRCRCCRKRRDTRWRTAGKTDR